MPIASFKELLIWQRSMKLAKDVYRLSSSLPADERYGLISQIRRSAVSIPSNIAEGHKRKTRNDFIQFLCIANGSMAELETQLLLIQDLYPSVDTSISLADIDEIQRMLTTMIQRLKNPPVS